MNKLEYLKKREIKLLIQRDRIIKYKSQDLNTTSTGLPKNILFFLFIHVSICIDLNLKESLNSIALVMEAIMNVTVSCFRM